MIKTVIFEDSKFDLRGLQSILKGIPEINVVAVFDTIGEALSECKKIAPDLIIADADIRGDKTVGPNFVRSVIKMLPNVKVLGLTIWPDCIDRLKRAGCKEAVLKQFFDNEQAAQKFIRETLVESPFFTNLEPPDLNEEEDQVLRMMGNGHTEEEIGGMLNKSRKQVRIIKGGLKDKFGVVSGRDTELVALAYRRRYLLPDEDLSGS